VPASFHFSTIEAALAQIEADLCLCVVPPALHEAVVTPALDAGLSVLTEKPMADSMDAGRRLVARAAASSGTLMVAQKGRFAPWVRQFQGRLRSGELGELSHMTHHFRANGIDWVVPGGSDFRHHMDDPLLIEQSIHHFDLIRALLGCNPVEVSGSSWNFAGSGYAGDIGTSLRFTMEDGYPVIYEAFIRSSGDATPWYGDIRAECDMGVVQLVNSEFEVLHRTGRGETPLITREGLGTVATVVDSGAQDLLLDEFVRAREERREPLSNAADNLFSLAMLFAAVEACHTGVSQKIADYVAPSPTDSDSG
jgi:predicted dehydrogenase